ncbi:hypothetical protein [Massilia brevitalea]|uniref:hypothetical protein n=1 Tax=Massilia brevitalea TaxID=442526 RepID=UPI002739F0BD|nr:hypothetical protein [Massilia brevitalea]
MHTFFDIRLESEFADTCWQPLVCRDVTALEFEVEANGEQDEKQDGNTPQCAGEQGDVFLPERDAVDIFEEVHHYPTGEIEQVETRPKQYLVR